MVMVKLIHLNYVSVIDDVLNIDPLVCLLNPVDCRYMYVVHVRVEQLNKKKIGFYYKFSIYVLWVYDIRIISIICLMIVSKLYRIICFTIYLTIIENDNDLVIKKNGNYL